jgi:hypothetical protein
MGGSQHSEGDKNLQNNSNCLHSGTASYPKRLKFSLCHLLWAHWDTFPQKWYQFDQEGFTIAQFSKHNVRFLEHCTRMWPPANSVIYCQHHEWVYKQPLYIMLKYGFLQRETMTTSNQENKFFRRSQEKDDGTQFLIFLEWCNLGFMFLWPRRKERFRNQICSDKPEFEFANTLWKETTAMNLKECSHH